MCKCCLVTSLEVCSLSHCLSFVIYARCVKHSHLYISAWLPRGPPLWQCSSGVNQWLFRNCAQTPWARKTLPPFLLVWLCVWEHIQNSDILHMSQLLHPTRPSHIFFVPTQAPCSSRDEWIVRALFGISCPCAAFQISRDFWEFTESHLSETMRLWLSHSPLSVKFFFCQLPFSCFLCPGLHPHTSFADLPYLFVTEIVPILDNNHRHGVVWCSIPNHMRTPPKKRFFGFFFFFHFFGCFLWHAGVVALWNEGS